MSNEGFQEEATPEQIPQDKIESERNPHADAMSNWMEQIESTPQDQK